MFQFPPAFVRLALPSVGKKAATTRWKNKFDSFFERIHQPDVMSLNQLSVHIDMYINIYIYIYTFGYCIYINVFLFFFLGGGMV